MPTPSADALRTILEAAILAPSADNQHRIRFHAIDDDLEILCSTLLAATGYKRILDLLSAGALLENLALAAGRHGWRAELTPFPDPARPQLLCRIVWSRQDQAADPLVEAIPARQTNRRLVYRGPPMGPAERNALQRAAAGQPGVTLMWLDEPPVRRRVLGLMRRAEAARFRIPALHQELFSAVRFEVGWQASCAEGLPPGALGVERPLRAGFALMRHWPVMRALNLLGAHRLLGLRAADLPCRLAPHLGLIALAEESDWALLAAGRAFERVWLAATQLGLALQPMPAAALYALEGAESVPVPLQRRLAQAWRALLPGLYPVMLFRLGRAAPLAVRTGRLPLEHYWPDRRGE
jgi:nitroreductase